MNTQLLHNELTSLSIPISGCDSEGRVDLLLQRNKVISIDNGDNTFGTQTLDEDSDEFIRATMLVELVLAAHEQPLSSTEALALQQACSEAEWLAYTECRKQPIRNARAARYATETDVLRLKMDEDALPDSEQWLAARDAWILAKNTIRNELPYE